MVYRVCVVGAGIIGVSTAVNILESIPNVEVTILAEKFSPDTTSSGIGGLWLPYLAKNTPQESIYKWGKTTWDHMMAILRSPYADEAGIHLKPIYDLFDVELDKDPFWKDIPLSYRRCNQQELDSLFPGYVSGFFFMTLFCLCRLYIPWLMKRYQARGGKVLKQSLSSLSEIADLYDVIVMCTGLGSHHLLGDKEVYPIRGELVKVKSSWTIATSAEKDGVLQSYLLPGIDHVFCGGLAQVDNWNEQSDPKDVQGVLEKCAQLVPSIKNAKVISSWAGLRPGRSSIRLEKENLRIETTIKKVVHNYGHGGSGATLHWGCAQDAAQLVMQSIQELNRSKL
ncbi:D-aspartate oxidase-like [Asterias rubens]|uniref:D-aspartate oxidase-like n=1 Tax=Asterias rubens TaxID=7604 RepID=UPI0014555F2F|nr:D-aspartate oxidase-like [Asterias rubens]